MKKYTFRILGLAAVLLLALGAIFMPEYSAEFLSFLGVGGSSGMMLGASFQGASTHKADADLSPTLIDRYIAKEVTTRRAQDVPLDTIMRSIRKPSVAKDFKVEYLEHEYTGFEDAANGAVTAVTGTPSATLVVDNGLMWAIDDLIRIPAVTPSGDGAELLVIVTARTGNSLTVTALNNGVNFPAITDNTVLYHGGNAKGELDAQTTIVLKQPVTLFNYAQIFMAQIQQSKYAALANKVGGFTYQNYVDEVIYGYKSKVAMAQVFSPTKSKATIGGVEKYLTKGIYSEVGNTINYGTGGGSFDPSLADINVLGEALWAGKDASQNKLMLAGSKVMSGLSNIDKFQRDLSAKDREIFHGVKVSSLTTPWGDVRVVYDPLMDKAGKQGEALVLDTDHVYKHEFKPVEGKQLDLDGSGQSRVQNAMRWDEASCLTLRYAGASGVHAVWKPTA